MRLLAFDTSGPALSAAVGDGDRLLAWRYEALARGHAERLLPTLSSVLAEAGWRWAEVEFVAVTIGPGNFTGLRAAIAVARALALSLGCPVLGLGTLDVLAEATADPADPRPILALLDARRDELYAQRFTAAAEPLEPPALARTEEAAALGRGCRLVGEPTAVAGEGSPQTADARDLLTLARRRLAAGATPTAGVALRPLYLRPPDARPGAGASLLPAAS